MEIKSANDIYLPNAKFEVNKIDFSDQEVKQRIVDINKKQEEILDRKVVDVEKLHEIVQL